MTVEIIHGDCIEQMRNMPDNSVDSIVTDPPYGLGFMGKKWDALPPGEEWAVECLRVLKPGGHLLSFGGTRTWHRLAVAVEDAGFEIRDSIAWMYGSGFPKSLDVSKAIDKANGRNFEDRYALGRHIRAQREAKGYTRAEVNAWFGYKDGCEHWERQDPSGARVPALADYEVLTDRLDLTEDHHALVERVAAEREVVGQKKSSLGGTVAAGERDPEYIESHRGKVFNITAPATPAAQEWEGWGTALKPAFEPVVVARKPIQGTVAGNVQTWGTGALNIDATRIATDDKLGGGANTGMTAETRHEGFARPWMKDDVTRDAAAARSRENTARAESLGRWPANVVLDETTAGLLDQQSGVVKSSPFNTKAGHAHGNGSTHGTFIAKESNEGGYSDSGGASRFFKVAKSDERGAISEHFPREFDAPFMYVAKAPKRERPVVDGVAHPTVKPLALMRWLVRLVTPPGGTVLEPFAGSGATVEACIMEGFNVIAIEQEADYLPLIQARIDRAA